MVEDTVVIKNLPSSLSHQDKTELLYHFGALEVNIIGASGGKRNLAFAKFENNTAAELAVKKLHNLIILEHRISAEISTKAISGGMLNPNKTSRDCDGLEYKIEKAKSMFLDKLALSINSYDFSKPPALNIHYQYPPPTKAILKNITKAMARSPKLYNQVLHLMNKMNFPCPFLDNNYEEECVIFQNTEQNSSIIDNKEEIQETLETMSTSESEIGSDGEYISQEIIPAKRKKVSKNTHVRPKFVKLQLSSNQTTKSSLRPDEVFENVSKEKSRRKIEVKITPNLSSIQEAQEVQHHNINTGFDKIIACEKKEFAGALKEDDDEDKNYPVISKDQLVANQIPQKDQRTLPAFKNYQAGVPSCRLYVKNLSKNVLSKDLHFIFRRYFRPELDQEQGSMFDIRLMQEGRMKGQAFITLQSKEQAQMALMETNGYILKGKPMVVQFARSANTAKK